MARLGPRIGKAKVITAGVAPSARVDRSSHSGSTNLPPPRTMFSTCLRTATRARALKVRARPPLPALERRGRETAREPALSELLQLTSPLLLPWDGPSCSVQPSAAVGNQRRNLSIHEYLSMNLLNEVRLRSSRLAPPSSPGRSADSSYPPPAVRRPDSQVQGGVLGRGGQAGRAELWCVLVRPLTSPRERR